MNLFLRALFDYHPHRKLFDARDVFKYPRLRRVLFLDFQIEDEFLSGCHFFPDFDNDQQQE